MKPLRSLLLATALIGAGTLAPAQAAPYTAFAPEHSQITFTYRQMGVSLEGHFQQFNGSLQFDPAQPEQAQATLDVALASIDTGLPDANAEVTKPEWFAAEQFPEARFETRAIRSLGEQRYEVDGALTIKGTTQQITLPATLTEADGRGTFAGSFTIRRGDFNIGEGMWSGFDLVANEVNVQFTLAATSAP